MNYSLKNNDFIPPSTTPHSPTAAWAWGPEQGHYQGNGDIYTSCWASDAGLTWSVGKTDVWDRRYYGDTRRVVTLEEIKKLVRDGHAEEIGNRSQLLPGSAQELNSAYDFPCPKPVGQVIVRTAGFPADALRDTELCLDDAVARLHARSGNAELRVEGFVSAVRNVIAFRGAWRGLPAPLRFEIYRHADTTIRGQTTLSLAGVHPQPDYDYDQDADNGPLPPPEIGWDGEFAWIRQRFHAEATFPNGFEYVIMAWVRGCTAVEVRAMEKGLGAAIALKPASDAERRRTHGAWRQKRLAFELLNDAPGSWASFAIGDTADDFEAYVSVFTTRDSENPYESAKEALRKARADRYPTLLAEHQRWWTAYWNRVHVASDDPARDSQWRRQDYLLGWMHRSGKVLINNIGQYTFTDSECWHGDYHFNEIWLHPRLIANRAEAVLPFLQMVEAMLPMAQRNAREVYGCRGCCYPIVGYPIRTTKVVYANAVWELGMELTAQITKPLYHYCMYTGDFAYLREHAYPVLREGARFYADFLTLEGDGCYHVFPTVSQENWGITANFALNKDSVGAISQIRNHLLLCAAAAERLGLDGDERKHWKHIAERMAPYPSAQTPEGPVFVDVAGNRFYEGPNSGPNLFADLSMVFWGDQLSLESDTEPLETARRTFKKRYRGIPGWEAGSGHHPYYYRSIERRLGLPRSIAYLDSEDLVMSYTGTIYLFPGIEQRQRVRVDRFLAWGGFEVSAEHGDAGVTDVRILSRAGEPCRIHNHWKGRCIRVAAAASRREIPALADDRAIRFETRAGEAYSIAAT